MAAPGSLSRLESAFRRVAGDLNDLGRQWALVGGLAVSARTEPRFTRDIDVAVLVTGDTDAEQLVHELQVRGYRVQAVLEQDATARLATALKDFTDEDVFRLRLEDHEFDLIISTHPSADWNRAARDVLRAARHAGIIQDSPSRD